MENNTGNITSNLKEGKVEDEFRVKQVNRTFLATVLVSVLASAAILLICYGVGKILNATGLYSGNLAVKVANILDNNFTINLLLSQVLLFAPAGIFIACNRAYFFKNLRIRRLKPKTYLMLAIFGVVFIPIISFVNSISLLFTENVIASEMTSMFDNTSLIECVIVVALIPCILEETVYRGVFYNEYSRINPRKAVLLSALLFGLLHMNFNQFLYAAFGGVVFALIVEGTGSITASMMMHFLLNASSTIVSYIGTKSASIEEAQQVVQDAPQEGMEMFSGVFSFMNNLPIMVQMVISLGILAIIAGMIEVVLFKKIVKTEGRQEYIRQLFGIKSKAKKQGGQISQDEITRRYEMERFGQSDIKEKYSDNQDSIIENEPEGSDFADDMSGDDSIPKQKVPIITPSLIVAMVICFAVMMLRQFGVL